MSAPTLRMAEEIRPYEDGGCSEDECPSYDGKRCQLTGCRPRGGCEPGWGRLRAHLRAVHEACGEDGDSDDDSLAEHVAIMLREREERIEALERDLATARRDAIEEAAKAVEGQIVHPWQIDTQAAFARVVRALAAGDGT